MTSTCAGKMKLKEILANSSGSLHLMPWKLEAPMICISRLKLILLEPAKRRTSTNTSRLMTAVGGARMTNQIALHHMTGFHLMIVTGSLEKISTLMSTNIGNLTLKTGTCQLRFAMRTEKIVRKLNMSGMMTCKMT